MRKVRNKQGFTLMELLCVVGMLVILTAMVIPVFDGSTEKAREAKDLSNLRSAAAAVVNSGLMGEKLSGVTQYPKTITASANSVYYYKEVPITQKVDKWRTNGNKYAYINGVEVKATNLYKYSKWRVTYYVKDTKGREEQITISPKT